MKRLYQVFKRLFQDESQFAKSDLFLTELELREMLAAYWRQAKLAALLLGVPLSVFFIILGIGLVFGR